MIHQEVQFDATPKQVYECLMDSKKHSEFTGAKAKIENKVGRKFSVWNGYATGENIELVIAKKIVQSWRASDWPKGKVSKLIIDLEDNKGRTKLTLTQVDVPEESEEDIKTGWNDYYWEPLKKYLKNY